MVEHHVEEFRIQLEGIHLLALHLMQMSHASENNFLPNYLLMILEVAWLDEKNKHLFNPI